MARILVFSDLHGDRRALERLMAMEADFYFCAGDLVNFARGFETMGPLMEARRERVYVLPGNHESHGDTRAFCARYGFQDFHGGTLTVDGVTVAGLGYSNPTPFHTPGEYSERELGERLAAFAGRAPLVLICHAPPFQTPLDEAGPGRHYGSTAVRAFIEAEAPRWFFCGHIHEAAGRECTLGTTHGANVGKAGYLLDLGTL